MLTLIDTHWASAPDGTKPAAYELVGRAAAGGHVPPAGLLDRLCEAAALDDSDTPVLGAFVAALDHVPEGQRRQTLAARHAHPTIAAHLQHLEDQQLLDLVYDVGHQGVLDSLLAVLPKDKAPQLIEDTVRARIDQGKPFAQEVTGQLLSALEQARQANVLGHATDALMNSNGDRMAALTTLTALRAISAGPDEATIRAIAVQLLTADLDPAAAEELGRLHKGLRRDRDVQNALAAMRSDGAEEAANAFEAASE